jgi:aminoglycoside 6'-N-acetyltransferase
VVELKGDRVVLRPLQVDDVAVLVEIQAQPSVARWWGRPNEEDLRRQAARESEETSFAIMVDGAVAGLIQYAEENEPMYRHAGIDLFLSEEFQNRGLGTDAVRTLARHLVHDRGHHRLTIDPSADNYAAIRAYEKVGFKPVGVMRQYERSSEGGWRDGLLMDLLADEL